MFSGIVWEDAPGVFCANVGKSKVIQALNFDNSAFALKDFMYQLSLNAVDENTILLEI